MKLTAQDQHPFAVVLSCIDSRTSAELIFDKGMGDLFSIRIAGNVLNDDILGSMEFACNVVGSKLIVVLGHTKCGAVKGACDCVEMGHLTGLVRKIKPAVDSIAQKLNVKSSSSNAIFVEEVADLNVQLVAKEITAKSEIIRSLVEQKKIMIVGGMYNVENGEVNFHESNN